MLEDAALLITDLVDSTLLTDQLGDEAMSALWQAHDLVSRDLLAQWQGTEVNRSDGFLLRFATVAAAIGYVIAYHRAIATLPHPLTARAGLHAGPVIERNNHPDHLLRGAKASELAGLAIHTVGRVMAIAMPGQTLMTSSARSAIGTTPLQIECHGHWRCKGIADPIELFEVGDELAPRITPRDGAKAYRVAHRNGRWLPVREVPHSLPAERNRFVGRHEDLRELEDRLDKGARLISVTGFGGTGKTRLVLQFGWRSLGDSNGGVWYCDLSNATSFDGLCSAVAQGLRLPLGQNDPAEQIGNAIAARGDCLIILDNFEQIVRFGSDSVGRWLDQTIDARFIVTTRNVLNLDGEAVMELSPLSSDEGKELFAIRAKAARTSFRLDADDEVNLTRLIRLLDGLPLAIELAAARVRILPLAGLLERMQERFSLLASDGGRAGRQMTLKATLDWSWDLLDEGERSAVAQLSVFEGGFGLRAYEAVILPDVEIRADPLQTLQSLVDKSWVQRADEGRFVLLRSVQDYAALQLTERTPEASAVARRYWIHFGSLDDRAAGACRCIDVDNLISATRRAIAAGAPSEASSCLLSSWWAIRRCGPFRSAIELGNRIRTMDGLSAADRARVEFTIGNAWRYTGMDDEAQRAFRIALDDARQAGAKREEGWILAAIGEQHTHAARWDAAEQSFDAALVLARSISDLATECAVLNSYGAMLRASNRATESFDPYQRALALARSLDDAHLEGGILGNLGGAYYSIGRLDEAEDHFARAIELVQKAGNRLWEGNMRCNLGLVYLERHKMPQAIRELESAVAEAKQLGHLRLECIALWNLGLAYEAMDQPRQAITQFIAASDIARSRNDRTSLARLLALSAPLAASSRGLDDSRALLDEARQVADEVGDLEGSTAVSCAHVLGACDQGMIDSALAAMADARATATRIEVRSDRIVKLLERCEHALRSRLS